MKKLTLITALCLSFFAGQSQALLDAPQDWDFEGGGFVAAWEVQSGVVLKFDLIRDGNQSTTSNFFTVPDSLISRDTSSTYWGDFFHVGILYADNQGNGGDGLYQALYNYKTGIISCPVSWMDEEGELKGTVFIPYLSGNLQRKANPKTIIAAPVTLNKVGTTAPWIKIYQGRKIKISYMGTVKFQIISRNGYVVTSSNRVGNFEYDISNLNKGNYSVIVEYDGNKTEHVSFVR